MYILYCSIFKYDFWNFFARACRANLKLQRRECRRTLEIFVNIELQEGRDGEQMSHLFVSALLIFNRNTCKSQEQERGGENLILILFYFFTFCLKFVLFIADTDTCFFFLFFSFSISVLILFFIGAFYSRYFFFYLFFMFFFFLFCSLLTSDT